MLAYNQGFWNCATSERRSVESPQILVCLKSKDTSITSKKDCTVHERSQQVPLMTTLPYCDVLHCRDTIGTSLEFLQRKTLQFCGTFNLEPMKLCNTSGYSTKHFMAGNCSKLNPFAHNYTKSFPLFCKVFMHQVFNCYHQYSSKIL